MNTTNMQDVYVVADNVFSPIGKTTGENFINLRNRISGVKSCNNLKLSDVTICASLFQEVLQHTTGSKYTKFEHLLISSITGALSKSNIDIGDDKTILIICSTKGNISLLETEELSSNLTKRISLSTSANLVAGYFGFVNKPVIISNACISGVMGIISGMRLLRERRYEKAVIAGADVISKFVLSGFQSFQALSSQVCKPFDKLRDGLNLGEGAGTIILSTDKQYANNIKVKGGSVSNDANHISGPSRTGAELGQAITRSLADACINTDDIDFISAHGTATVYNDEMEASAIALAGLKRVPLNSLKGYYGHTLGAAGLIESIISIQSMREGVFLPTPGFAESGVSSDVNVCITSMEMAAKNIMKTASGFGGCNGAVVFGK